MIRWILMAEANAIVIDRLRAFRRRLSVDGTIVAARGIGVIAGVV